MELDELAAQLKDATKKLKKQKDVDAPFAPRSAEPQQAFSLVPVSDYLHHLEKEPREILEARYHATLGIAPPKEARHDWLVTRVAYHFQVKYYQAQLGEWSVPKNVLYRSVEAGLASWYPRDGRTYDADDPRDEVEIWDDTFVVAAVPNPYARGDARVSFHAIEMSGDAGIQFEPLSKQLESLMDTAVGTAQDKALWYFTSGVRGGITKVVIR